VSTTIRPVTATGRLLGARQLATVVTRVADSQMEWLTRVRLNPSGRWYEQIHLDDSHEVWLISWLPGQETGFHDHGGASGAFTVALGTLVENRVSAARQVVSKPLGAGGVRSFGPRYIHNVRNGAAASIAISVHAYSPPLTAMRRYEMTPSGLTLVRTDHAELDW
jgi:predicted metal-dependent enzyme (double-stranded beta helix superfamily)